MLKQVSKRFLSLGLVLVMLVSMIPATALPAYAASGSLTMSSEGLTASFTGDGTWSGGGTSASGSVTGAKNSCNTDEAKSATLTFANGRDKAANISFDYNITKNTGSVTIDGVEVTESGTYAPSELLAAGDTVQIVITSGAGSGSTTSIELSNVSLVVDSTATTTFQAPVNGSYTVNGEAITADTQKSQKSTEAYDLVATPAEGYNFLGWYSSLANGYISYTPTASINVETDTTIYPVFMSSKVAVFQVGNNKYTDLNEANEAAKADSSKQITLVQSGSIEAGTYEISAGVKLLIPYNDAHTANFSDEPTCTMTKVAPTMYACLTLPEGAVINCYGNINVNAQQLALSTNTTGTVSGPYGAIQMDAGSQISLKNGANLYAYGYIGGNGMVWGESGSHVYQFMQIRDWRGGANSATLLTSLKDNSFLFSQYYLQNIEATLRLDSGCTMYGSAAIAAGVTDGSKTPNQTCAAIVGKDEGMFHVTDGYALLKYDDATDRMTLDFYGNLVTDAISMKMNLTGLLSSSMNTKDYILALPMNYTINVKSGSTVTFAQKFKLLPGTVVNVEAGANATIADGGALYLYDKDDWKSGTYAYNTTMFQLEYVFAKKGEPVKRSITEDAVLRIDGNLTANGPIYSTKHVAAGGNAGITGSGTYVTNVYGTTNLKEVVGSGTTTLTTITCVPVVGALAGHESQKSLGLGTYRSINGKWYQFTVTGEGFEFVSGVEVVEGVGYTANAMSEIIVVEGEDDTTAEDDAQVDMGKAMIVISAEGECYTATNAQVVPVAALIEPPQYQITNITGNVKIVAGQHDPVEVPGKAPTCTESGLTDGVKCANGGNMIVPQEEIPALGHSVAEGAEGVVTKAPTCVGDGVLTFYCTRCGEAARTEVINKTGSHTYGEWVEETSATCTAEGTLKRTCSVCGDFETKSIEKLAHTYTEEITKAATCGVEGEKTFTCSCGDFYTQNIPATGAHTWVLTETVDAPTCTGAGVGLYTCTVCKQTKQEALDATGHAPETDGAVEPTCTTTGLTEGSHCAVCQAVLVEQKVVDALGHDYKAVVTAPTCTAQGYTTHTCTRCGDSYVDSYTSIDSDNHNYDSTKTYAPTCTAQGYTVNLCAICGHEEKVEDSQVDALGHRYNSAVTAPTCTEQGYTTYTCSRDCGSTYVSDYTSVKGHIYETVLTAPTCTTQGYTIYKCSECGDSYEDNIVAALGHIYMDGDVTKKPTCTEAGVQKTICGNCSDVKNKELRPLGHDHYYEQEVDPTCTQLGSGKNLCFRCNYVAEVEVPMVGHTSQLLPAKAPTCTESGLTEGYKCSVCEGIITPQETVDPLGHTEESIPGKAATCIATGLTEGKKCTACGEITVEQQVLELLGHTEVNVPAVPPTCTEGGVTEGVQCSVCGQVISGLEIVEPSDHKYGSWTVSKVASCQEEGKQESTCEVCNQTFTQMIDRLPHTKVKVPGRAPTYAEPGLTDGELCSTCNEYLVEQQVIDKLILDWDSFISSMKQLEVYAEEYAASNPGKDATKLVINFIRTGVDRYNDDDWTTMAGPAETVFINEVLAKDEIYGTHASALRYLVDIKVPNGQTMEFGHLFGALNVASKNNYAISFADFGSWAGDLCDLMQYTQDKLTATEIEAMVQEITANYFGIDAANVSGFGMDDVRADLDSFYIVSKITAGETELSTIFEEYYTAEQSDQTRASYFLNNRFPGSLTKEAVRESIYNTYANHLMIQLLESGRGLSGETDLRYASCYTFADYLFGLAEGTLVAPETPDENPDDTPGHPGVYQVFSSTQSTLAPGVTQKINYALNADGNQIVFYTAKVDLSRDDLNIYANYANHDPSVWAMSPVSEQMAAAQKVHGDPNSAEYIPNYNAVVGVNASFYNMSTGQPSGLLVMDGTTYSEVSSRNFFAVLKDGTPIIATASEYETYKDQIVEAVGGGTILIKDGESKFDSTATATNPRCCVGITADGEVILLVLDGRQAPFSVGATYYEIAQILLDEGCVQALELDGGGSATFDAKQEGSDEVSLVNRPCDSVERAVSSSLVVVSTAVTSKEFHHAVVNTATDYLTVGSSLNVELIGVGEAGNQADIPEDAYLQVSDETIGKVENGVFTALARGTVEIRLVRNGEIVGRKSVEVIRRPDALKFTEKNLNVIRGIPEELPLVATYQNSPVTINVNDIDFELSNSAGAMDGFAFVGDENSTWRNVTVTAKVKTNVNITASMGLSLYSSDEGIFDFDNVTAGNASLAWNRVVNNTTTLDEVHYYLQNAGEPVWADYTFALDMKEIKAPARLQPLMEYLNGFAGNVGENATPWDYLLALGGRVSDLTNVTIKAKFSENVEVDTSDLAFINDFMTIKDAVYDKETLTLTITLGWIRQSEGIDPATANSIGILSGLKVTPVDSVARVGSISVDISGNVTYDIYLDTSQLHSFAKDPANQQKYNIYDYVNPDDAEDAGGHFMDTYITFEDHFSVHKSALSGWVSNGELNYYYQNNVKITGVYLATDMEGSANSYYYNFGEDGVCTGKYTGMFYDTVASAYRYARFGELVSGWVMVGDSYRYFMPELYDAANGKVKTGDGITFEFEDGLVKRGVWVRNVNGVRYWYGPAYHKKVSSTSSGLYEVEGVKYIFGTTGYRKTGIVTDSTALGSTIRYYDCGTDGKAVLYTGIYNRYVIVDGIRQDANQLVEYDGAFYYTDAGQKITANQMVYLTDAHVQGKAYADGSPMCPGYYNFGTDGKMIIQNGPIDGYFYLNGARLSAYQLVEHEGDFYCISDAHKLVVNRTAYLSNKFVAGKTFDDGTPIAEGYYTFDATGKMQLKNGPIDGYFYKNNAIVKAYQLVEYEGDFYCISDNNKLITNRTAYLSEKFVTGKTFVDGTPIAEGYYTFDATGKMQLKNGPIDGYFYKNNAIVKAYQLVEYEGDFYCISDNNKLITNRTAYLSEKFVTGKTFADGTTIQVGNYEFDAKGKMILKDGPVDGYFYKKNVLQTAYQLVEHEGDFYCISDGHKLVTNRRAYLSQRFVEGHTFADGSPMTVGYYDFDASGKMSILNGPVGDYFYVNNTKEPSYQLVQFEGEYYCTGDYQKLIKNRTAYLSERFVAGKTFADGSPMTVGYYEFDADGKMIIKNGPVGDYFYINNAQVKSYQLVKFEGEYYCTGDYQKLIKNRTAYLSERFVKGHTCDDGSELQVGYFDFDADGKMVIKNGPVDGYFYKNNVIQKAYQVVEFEGYYYCISQSYKLVTDRQAYVSERFVDGVIFSDGSTIEPGYYRFDQSGKMQVWVDVHGRIYGGFDENGDPIE